MCYLGGQHEPEMLTALRTSLLLFWPMSLTPSLITGPYWAESSRAVNSVAGCTWEDGQCFGSPSATREFYLHSQVLLSSASVMWCKEQQSLHLSHCKNMKAKTLLQLQEIMLCYNTR